MAVLAGSHTVTAPAPRGTEKRGRARVARAAACALLLLVRQLGVLGRLDERLVDVRDDTSARDGGLDQRVQLLITADRELQVAGRDALHLQRGTKHRSTAKVDTRQFRLSQANTRQPTKPFAKKTPTYNLRINNKTLFLD